MILLLLLLACAGGKADAGDIAGDTGDHDTAGDTDTDTDIDPDTDSDTAATDADGDGVPATDDCDDDDPTVHPAADEVCDGVDQDCDGAVDDDPVDPTTWHLDLDGDGFGDPASATDGCVAPVGMITDGTDCDDDDADGDGDGWTTCLGDCNDADPAVHPDADEVCDDADADEDCDGLSDSSDPSLTDGSPYHVDADGDTFGDDTTLVSACEPGAGRAEVAGDCDDADATIHPGATDVCGDTVDDNCDGWTPACGVTGSHDPGEAVGKVVETHADAQLGYPHGLARAGDIDGDGRADVLVSARYGTGRVSASGAVWLLPGQVEGLVPVSDAPVTLQGETTFDEFGGGVWGRGDLDGDGIPDVVVGACGVDSHGTNNGAVYLFEGPLSGTAVAGAAPAVLEGSSSRGEIGSDIGVGDFDGDGTLDVVTPGRWGGFAWRGPFPDGTRDTDHADLTLTREDGGSWHAIAVSDLDGDGLPDLVLTAPDATVDDTQGIGQVYVYVGGIPPSGDAAATANAVISGDDEQALLGYSLDSSGDFDGDGLADVLVGAVSEDTSATRAGAVFLYYSPLGSALGVTDAAARWDGLNALDGFGGSILAAGDTNGDGMEDYVLAGAGVDDGASEGGAAYFFLGG